mgnify:CR=1 FL=1
MTCDERHHATGCFALALPLSVALNLLILGLLWGASLPR